MDGPTMEVGDAKLSQPYIGNCDGFVPRAFAILEVARLHPFVSTCPFSCLAFDDFYRVPCHGTCLFGAGSRLKHDYLWMTGMHIVGCRRRLDWFGMGISSSEHRRRWREEEQKLKRRRQQRRSYRQLRNWTVSARARIVQSQRKQYPAASEAGRPIRGRFLSEGSIKVLVGNKCWARDRDVLRPK